MSTPPPEISNISSTSSLSYESIKEKAIQVETLYRDNGIELPRSCDLAKHIHDAIETEANWRAGTPNRITAAQLYHGVQMLRIARGMASLGANEKTPHYLRQLTQGSLDAFDRVQSTAKDFLWEMELCTTLRQHGLETDLKEPDVVLKNWDPGVGVACKKIYSRKGVGKILSEAAKQIKTSSPAGGFFAINIEELQTSNTIRIAASERALGQSMQADNWKFLGDFEQHFRRYMETGRSMCALVASGLVAHINGSPVTARQYTAWVIPSGLNADATRIMEEFRQMLGRSPRE
jgi:hypothetical protein